jgi:hypothetical protein
MATIRRLEVSRYDDDGHPIYQEKLYDQIFLEGFKSEAEALPYAKSAARDPHVVQAWIQPASMPFADPQRRAQAIKHPQPSKNIEIER